MVVIHIICPSEESANEILDYLFEENLLFEAVTATQVKKRSKASKVVQTAELIVGITKALLFKYIDRELKSKFPDLDLTIYSLPVVDMDPEKQKELINNTKSGLLDQN